MTDPIREQVHALVKANPHVPLERLLVEIMDVYRARGESLVRSARAKAVWAARKASSQPQTVSAP